MLKIQQMKKLLLIVLSIVSIATSCRKEEDKRCPDVTVTAPASEVANLKAYLQTNNITAVEDPRGFFYTIDAAGSGTKPTACSGVIVNYVGRLTNGTTFDSGTNVSFNLGGLITGWQEGIPLIGTGGSITLYLPPSLAYGSRSAGSIPPNSNLIFKIDLKAVY
jgi:FKBP-type peptidyl-prolyl cis-trans isomerase FkpA